MLNNRELATVILLGLFVLASCCLEGVRSSVWPVLKTFFQWKLTLVWVTLAAVVGGATVGLHAVGLNYAGSTKDAVVWTLLAGLPLIFKFHAATKEPGLMRDTLLSAFRLTAFVEFFVNLYVFPLIVEILLQAGIAFAAVMSSFASADAKFSDARKLFDGLLVLAGGAGFVFVAIHVAQHPRAVVTLATALSFIQPVVLSVLVAALVYVVGLVSAYELAFLRIELVEAPKRQQRLAKLALVRTFTCRVHTVHGLPFRLLQQLAEQETWLQARQVLEGSLMKSKNRPVQPSRG